MENTAKRTSPVIIGGSGGSGTRVVAEIILNAGVYLGQDLNESNDNLLFTYLFKHPHRFARDLDKNDSRLSWLFELHEKLFLGNSPNNTKELKMLWEAGKEHVFVSRRYNIFWVLGRMLHILMSKPLRPSLWGWKEPYTGYFLNAIHSYYPSAKYILVVRNGLDMAYTSTNQQLKYWSKWLEINPRDLSPKNKFEYWYHYNKHIMVRAKGLFGDHFLIIKLEDLCLERETNIKKLLNHIGIESESMSDDVINLPILPESYNRFLKHDTGWVDSNVKGKLAEFGYSAEVV